MRITKEMQLLREMLDKEGIEWEDASEFRMFPVERTRFNHRGYKWSVIHGYGTYGGFNRHSTKDPGLLELMSHAVDNGLPHGWLTAKEVIAYVKGEAK